MGKLHNIAQGNFETFENIFKSQLLKRTRFFLTAVSCMIVMLVFNVLFRLSRQN